MNVDIVIVIMIVMNNSSTKENATNLIAEHAASVVVKAGGQIVVQRMHSTPSLFQMPSACGQPWPITLSIRMRLGVECMR